MEPIKITSIQSGIADYSCQLISAYISSQGCLIIHAGFSSDFTSMTTNSPRRGASQRSEWGAQKPGERGASPTPSPPGFVSSARGLPASGLSLLTDHRSLLPPLPPSPAHTTLTASDRPRFTNFPIYQSTALPSFHSSTLLSTEVTNQKSAIKNQKSLRRYLNSTTPDPNLRVSTSSKSILSCNAPNIRFPPPRMTGWM
jgi:hypothetical protein